MNKSYLKRIIQKAAQIEELIDKYFIDENGVVYSNIDAETMKPWGDDNWKGYFDYLKIPGHSPQDTLSYEDCGITTGSYLAAMTCKYLATGSPEALCQAQRSFAAIKHIYHTGIAMEEGFFPKIHGGKFSRQTSSDQYLYAMKGMEFYSKIASKEDKETIGRMIMHMADFWMKRNYVYDYYSIKDMQWKPGRFPAFMALAFQFTGKERFKREFQRLNAEEKVYLRPWESQLLNIKNKPLSELEKGLDGLRLLHCTAESAAMEIMNLDTCLKYSDNDEYRKNWLHSMRQIWEEGKLSLTANGMAYRHILYSPETRQAFPLTKTYYRKDNPLKFDFFNIYDDSLTPKSLVLARVGLIVNRYFPDEKALETTVDIIDKVDIDSIRPYVPGKVSRLRAEHRYLEQSIIGSALTNWLWACRQLQKEMSNEDI